MPAVPLTVPIDKLVLSVSVTAPVLPASTATALVGRVRTTAPPPSRSSPFATTACVCVTVLASVSTSVFAVMPIVPATVPMDSAALSVRLTKPVLPASVATVLPGCVSV